MGLWRVEHFCRGGSPAWALAQPAWCRTGLSLLAVTSAGCGPECTVEVVIAFSW